MGACEQFCADVDGCENEFFAEAVRKAAKEHKCCECGETIRPGEKYERACGKAEGYWFSAKTCLACAEVRRAMFCGGWLYETMWDDLREQSFPEMAHVGPFECYAEIKSTSARDKLQAQFEEWMDLGGLTQAMREQFTDARQLVTTARAALDTGGDDGCIVCGGVGYTTDDDGKYRRCDCKGKLNDSDKE